MNRPMIGIPSVSLGSIEGPAVRATEREDDVIKLTMTEGNPGGVSTKTDSADSPLHNLCFPSGKYVGREEVHEEGNISGCSGCTMGHRIMYQFPSGKGVQICSSTSSPTLNGVHVDTIDPVAIDIITASS